MGYNRRRFLLTMPAALTAMAVGAPRWAHSAALPKAGIGTWDIDNKSTALKHVKQLALPWYYNWQPRPLWSSVPDWSGFVPMIWGLKQLTDENLQAVTYSPAKVLLGFNEPDNRNQANLSVKQALRAWPRLVATGKRLGSPAPTTEGLWWLDEFMAANPKVDFICVHHYTTNKDVRALKSYLRGVRARYKKPVWLTEWALADWNNPGRFSAREQAEYAEKALPMLEGLRFLKRHSWFAMYPGGDGWYINSELLDGSGNLTAVGQVYTGQVA